MRNVIVAGANGFLGSALIQRFIKEDVHIWALSRRNTENICANKNITWIEENNKISLLLLILLQWCKEYLYIKK